MLYKNVDNLLDDILQFYTLSTARGTPCVLHTNN
jgi:hypothetical protein